MAKGKSTWKYNKLLTARRNYFNDGGTKGNIFQNAGADIKTAFTNPGAALGGLSSGAGTFGMTSMLGAAAGAIGDIGGKLLSNGLESKAGGIVSGVGDALGGIPIVGGFAKGALNLIGGGVNALFGSKLNQANINAANSDINRMNNATADAASFDALSQKIASTAGRTIHGKSFYGRNGVFSNKAGKIQREMEERARVASERQSLALLNNAEDLSANQLMGLEANYAAFGGPMDFGGGAIGFDFMNRYIMAKEAASQGKDDSMTSLPNSFARGGSIHIKPENKGKFTETKRRTGKTTEELTHSSNPLTRKRAIFAQNAKKWHHAFGGELNTQGGDFTNGMIFIDNGGSHETNPFEGVPMGVDENGVPNLVEEGETIFNDYVFSKRLTVPKTIRNKYKLRGTKDMSFAEASKQMAKESEERPNDPISQRGLVALMSDLASSQESIKDNSMSREFAEGGHLFAGGGGLRYNNDVLSETDPLYGTYKDYLTDGRIDFGKLYDPGSTWMSRRAKVLNLLGKGAKESRGFREWYAKQLNDYNKDRTGYTPYTADDITQDLVSRWSSDRKLGFGHNVMGYEGLDQFIGDRKAGERRYLLGPDKDANGTPLDPYAGATIIRGYNPNDALYSFVSKKATSEGDTDFTDYYYRKLESDPTPVSKNRYFIKGANGKYTEYTGEDPSLYMKNNGFFAVSNSDNDTGGTDYFYDPQEEVKRGKYADWLRYAPAVGFGIGTLTDLFGLTNKPDYSNADAITEAVRDSGTYQPVKFNPIGNYLTYNPLDRDYYINKLNAEAGATRRSIMNTSGGNRGTAMASLLAADNNFLNQIGGLARQAEEYNLAQRQQVEDFNRATNMTNSQGFLQADMANQKAQAEMREFGLKGIMSAAQMREAARQAADAAKSANISGLFQTLGDIGFEERNAKMRDWAIRHGVFGPGVEDYGRIKRAKGGKIKRRKGLTF